MPDAFVTALVGAAGGLVSAALAYWFGIRRDIAKLKAELRYERTAARVGKRDEVIDEIWKAAQTALARAAATTSMLKQYPDFRRLTDEAARDIVEASPLTDRQKKELLESHDRSSYYQNAIFWHELHEARGALYDLNKSFLENKIHVPEQLAEVIAHLIKALNDAYISYEVWYESKDRELMKRMRSEIKQSEELGEEMEITMRSIFNEGDQD